MMSDAMDAARFMKVSSVDGANDRERSRGGASYDQLSVSQTRLSQLLVLAGGVGAGGFGGGVAAGAPEPPPPPPQADRPNSATTVSAARKLVRRCMSFFRDLC